MSFLDVFTSQSRRRDLRRQIEKLMGNGTGIYFNSWQIDRTNPDANTLSMQILEWCRKCLVRTRRPYGLSFTSVVLTISGENSEPVASVPFSGVLPGEFYNEGKVEQGIRETIAGWKDSGVFGQDPNLRIKASMFSWGDLIHRLLNDKASP